MSVLMLILVLFGITFFCICGSYFAGLIGEFFRGDVFAVVEQKARAAIEAADLGWVALVCGPFCGLFLGSIVLPSEDWLRKVRPVASLSYGQTVLVTIFVGSVAGVIVAAAYWTTSAVLGKAREWGKKSATVRDPDLDAPI